MRYVMFSLALGMLSTEVSAQAIRIETVVATPNEHDALALRAMRSLQGVIRGCFARAGEGSGSGRVVMRARLERGRVADIAVVSTSGTPNATAVQCTLQHVRSRLRFYEDSIEALVIPLRFEYPELELPPNAWSSAREARRRARCLRDAANELVAAIRAFERSRGRARTRAHARVVAAQGALAACDAVLGIGVGLQPGHGISNECPGCRTISDRSSDSNERARSQVDQVGVVD